MSGSANAEDGDMGFQIAPMVDVVFVLMLFFMASAGQQVTERELTTRLPSYRETTQERPGDIVPILLEISADGQVVANNTSFGTPTDKQLLSPRDWLKATQSFGGEDPVILKPNSATRHSRIVDVLDACAAAGIKKLTFG